MSKFNPLSAIVQQAQELQERVSRMQEEAAARTVEGAAGGGMVVARMNGKLDLLSLRIDPQLVEGGDVQMIQDLVLAAVNQAIRQAQELMADQVKQITGGLKIPGLG
jgi:hypothetical protein